MTKIIDEENNIGDTLVSQSLLSFHETSNIEKKSNEENKLINQNLVKTDSHEDIYRQEKSSMSLDVLKDPKISNLDCLVVESDALVDTTPTNDFEKGKEREFPDPRKSILHDNEVNVKDSSSTTTDFDISIWNSKIKKDLCIDSNIRITTHPVFSQSELIIVIIFINQNQSRIPLCDVSLKLDSPSNLTMNSIDQIFIEELTSLQSVRVVIFVNTVLGGWARFR